MNGQPPARFRLAVAGSPIAHSRSPQIQSAAFAVLGLHWEYGRAEVTEERLPGFLDGLDGQWRGVSLTMPLKRAVLPFLADREPMVDAVGAANTVRCTDQGLTGANTDVSGVERALRTAGLEGAGDVLLLGGGATAASALAGLAVLAGPTGLGGRRVRVAVRTPEKAEPLVELGRRLGLAVGIHPLADATTLAQAEPPDLVVNTLPGHAEHGVTLPESVRSTAALFDVSYDPWPSRFAADWAGTVVSGFDLLVHQAVGQLRFWVHGDTARPLDREDQVIAAMYGALS